MENENKIAGVVVYCNDSLRFGLIWGAGQTKREARDNAKKYFPRAVWRDEGFESFEDYFTDSGILHTAGAEQDFIDAVEENDGAVNYYIDNGIAYFSRPV